MSMWHEETSSLDGKLTPDYLSVIPGESEQRSRSTTLSGHLGVLPDRAWLLSERELAQVHRQQAESVTTLLVPAHSSGLLSAEQQRSYMQIHRYSVSPALSNNNLVPSSRQFASSQSVRTIYEIMSEAGKKPYDCFKQLIRMEELVMKLQSNHSGITVKSVQSFMSKIPSVFTGADLIEWIQQNVHTIDQIEAIHLCHMISAHGYIFPIDDHILTVKNDGTYYRFQTKCFWLSRCHEPDNTDYAVYLCKRTMQNKHRLELADYEAENLARLQKMFSRKWEFIYLQAEAQVKVDKKRDKQEKKILDSQERAFWDLHRPAPGCINTTEVDIKKACRMQTKSSSHKIKGCPETRGTVAESLMGQIEFLNHQLERRRQKVSKVAEGLNTYWEMYAEFDPVINPPEQGNPWVTDGTEFWETDSSNLCVPVRRYKRWVFSILDLLKDPAGLEEFHKFLQKEFSAENLEFWLACRKLKSLPNGEVKTRVAEIYVEYLADGAKNAVNVDSQVADTVKQNVVTNPSRYAFDTAEEHIYNLMKNDSYTRFMRSDQYKDYVSNMKKSRTTPNKISLFGTKQMMMPNNSSTT